MQREDFEGLFETMAGYPVTIRLLDPPLHEFLPHGKDEVGALARAMKLPAARLERLVASLVEANPMLGIAGAGWNHVSRDHRDARRGRFSRRRAAW